MQHNAQLDTLQMDALFSHIDGVAEGGHARQEIDRPDVGAAPVPPDAPAAVYARGVFKATLQEGPG